MKVGPSLQSNDPSQAEVRERTPADGLRVVIIEDEITPYRTPIYRRISRKLAQLRVLYTASALRFPDDLQIDTSGVSHEVLPGLRIRLAKPAYGESRYIVINPTLLWELLRIRPDVVVGYAFSVPAWIAFLYAKATGAAFVSWSTGTLHTERHLGRLQRLSRRWIIDGADGYLTASTAGVEKFAAYGVPPARVTVVTQRTLEVSQEPSSKPAANHVCRFLFVGGLSDRKGTELLLRAFAALRASGQPGTLILVGDGPLRQRLERLAETEGVASDVNFLGFVAPDRLTDVYREADVFVFPSREDTFGVALADAAAAGLPIIASPYAGATGDYVEASVNGFIIDPADIDLLAQRMTELASSPGRRTRMGAASLGRARERSLDQAAENLIEALSRAGSRSHTEEDHHRDPN